MTELQQTEFEILNALDRVCAQLRIPYYLVCGSALGAVKYSGFIPWDDDIDVAMFREDYERFLREAPALLPEALFLQNYHTEPAFPQIYSKLRNSNTTYIEKSAAHLPINHGVFIDIFPLDGYPQGKLAGSILEMKKRLSVSMFHSVYNVPRSSLGTLACGIWRILRVDKKLQTVASGFERTIAKYPVAGSHLACNHGNWQGKLDYSPVCHFGEGAWFDFEGLRVRVPAQYHDYLFQKYGDYTEDPPAEQQTGHHHYAVCDCKQPYTYYTNRTEEKT